jgi:hypothetical protein
MEGQEGVKEGQRCDDARSGGRTVQAEDGGAESAHRVRRHAGHQQARVCYNTYYTYLLICHSLITAHIT